MKKKSHRFSGTLAPIFIMFGNCILFVEFAAVKWCGVAVSLAVVNMWKRLAVLLIPY